MPWRQLAMSRAAKATQTTVPWRARVEMAQRVLADTKHHALLELLLIKRRLQIGICSRTYMGSNALN